MAPDVNSKPWGTQPLTTLKASPVDDHPSFNPTAGPSRGNQHGTDMRNIITDDMRFFFRDIFYKYCDEPEQPEYQRQIDNVDSDQNSDSDSDSDFLDDDDILPELIGLVLAQHRMVLSLRDAKKETDVQLRITNSRLNLVEEELTLIRTSMAEQATPSLFSGVRMGSSFGSAERDTASDYIPKFDLTDIGATLAAGPGPQSDFIQPRHLVRDGSPSPRSSNQRRRSPRPERYVLVPTWLAKCPAPNSRTNNNIVRSTSSAPEYRTMASVVKTPRYLRRRTSSPRHPSRNLRSPSPMRPQRPR